MKQGSWVFDIKSMKATKITPYIANKFLIFPELDYVLIETDEHVYRVKTDGSERTELTDIANKGRFIKARKVMNEQKYWIVKNIW